VSVFHFNVNLYCNDSIVVFPCNFFWCNSVTTANISLPVVFTGRDKTTGRGIFFGPGQKKKTKGYERDEDQCFYIRKNTKKVDQDAPVEDHSKVYRLVQRDGKSISALRNAIDGKEFPIENIGMAHRVLALIKGDTNVEDERGVPCNLGEVNGNKRRSPRARNQVKDNEKEEDGRGARATRRSKWREEEEEEDAVEEEEEEELHSPSSSGIHIVRYMFFKDSMTLNNSKVRF
jgi:hypothetical protein